MNLLSVAKLTTFKSKNLLNFLHFNETCSGQLLHLINQPISTDTIRTIEIILETFKHRLEEDTQIKQFKELRGGLRNFKNMQTFFEKDVFVIRFTS
jgi:hypothetical protein